MSVRVAVCACVCVCSDFASLVVSILCARACVCVCEAHTQELFTSTRPSSPTTLSLIVPQLLDRHKPQPPKIALQRVNEQLTAIEPE